MSVTVIQFTTLDGVVSDPDGSDGTPYGGWLLRYGRAEIEGDRFRLAGLLDEGVLLLGCGTWEAFARLWPGREGPFADRMNAVAKRVASRTLTDVSAWANSTVLDGDLLDAVKREQREVIVMGSLSVVRTLMAQDLVDEYRLITFPTVLGAGERLFAPDGPAAHLECLEVEKPGATVFARYGRAAR
ncbi:dihydrofolate reductase family protein [Streptomyces sp. NPDC091280]|uniref:dihydrofolate reductase family protein n=1 Tax=Streptomyces sp. NPDC091280 TaxID=3365984 RepID=UPI0037F317E9